MFSFFKKKKNPTNSENESSEKKQVENKNEEVKIEEIKDEEIKEQEKENMLIGEIEQLVGTKINNYPMYLYDRNEKLLSIPKEDLNPNVLYEKFFLKYIQNFKYPEDKDEYRPNYGNKKKGGIDFKYKKTMKLIRSIGIDLLKEIGKKLLSGQFNLTTVSFPIKVMIPITVLQHICNGHFNYPLYLNLAYISGDYLERLKLVIVATLSSWYKSSVMLKPLNPVLGETYEMIWEDGSHEYVEQTCHHPPTSNFYILGPKKNWIYCGYFSFTSSAFINSVKLKNNGKRYIKFKDGTYITFNYSVDEYSNTFVGNFIHESLGEMIFRDETHGLQTKFKLGNYKEKKLSDYFIGEIKDDNGKILSKFKGSYLSYIEFDGVRYWDIRRNIDIDYYPVKDQIKGSSIYREDCQLLYERKMQEAQKAKEKIEELQRYDKKLRDTWEKERKKKK
jgi:hypothetical protein